MLIAWGMKLNAEVKLSFVKVVMDMKKAHSTTDVRIVAATSAEEIETARVLFREYRAGLSVIPSCASSFCQQGFEAEIASLPGRFAPPEGLILLAFDGGNTVHNAIGTVALRKIEDGICEMKRMYVRPSHRGRGVGRMLAVRLLQEARRLNYRTMKLDSEPVLVAAMSLYRSLGFREIERYNDDPEPCTVFMGLEL